MSKVTIEITEQTLSELNAAIRKAFYGGKKPSMVYVTSEYSPINFHIRLEKQPNTQESLGYQVAGIGEQLPATEGGEV